jgi:hypothetical protein
LAQAHLDDDRVGILGGAVSRRHRALDQTNAGGGELVQGIECCLLVHGYLSEKLMLGRADPH